MPSVTSVNTRRLLRGRYRKPDTLPSAPIIQDAYPTPNGFIAIIKRTSSGISGNGINQITHYEYSLTGAEGPWIADANLTSVMPLTGRYEAYSYWGYYTPGDKVSVVVSDVTKQYLCVSFTNAMHPLYDNEGSIWLPLENLNNANYVSLSDASFHASAFLFTPVYDTSYNLRVRAVTSVGTSESSAPFTTVQAGPTHMVGSSDYTQYYNREGYSSYTLPSTRILLNTADLQGKYGNIPDTLDVRMGAYSNCLNFSLPSSLPLTYYKARFNKSNTVGASTIYRFISTNGIAGDPAFTTYPNCMVVLLLQQQAGKHWPGWSQQPDYAGIIAQPVPQLYDAFVYTITPQNYN